jgi:putative endonuclease
MTKPAGLSPNSEKKWYVYIIENRLGHYYTGICTNIERRFNEHLASGAKCAKALKGKGPLTLKFSSQVEDHSCALKTEIWIKKLSKADKIKLVNNQLANAPIQNMETI